MSATSFSEVANHFVKFYYEKFSQNRAELLALYRNESILSWENKTIQGGADILKKLQEIPRSVKFQLTTLDSHPTVNEGVLILVIGDLSIDGGPVMKFSHVFHLQKGGAAYFVLNEIFRLSIG